MWNSLLCECVLDQSMITCSAPCDEEAPFPDPFQPCVCHNITEIFEFFPSWATEQAIELALDVYEKWVEPTVPTDWPVCDIWCGGAPLNMLACECMALDYCPIECGMDFMVDPFDGCSCVTPGEYLEYYPDWATIDDAYLAEGLAWEQYYYDEEFQRFDQSDDWLAPPEEPEEPEPETPTGAASFFATIAATMAALLVSMF